MYDAIVVGGRCAGAATAMLLGRRGYRVLLVDKARFPSDIPHGHFIHKDGPPRLRRWGLLDRIVATNCPPTTAQVLDFGDYPLIARDLAVDGVAWGYGPRRALFDSIMIDAAREAGVEVREGFTVDAFTGHGDRITGIAGRNGSTPRGVVEQARVTIGADGRHSALARAVDAPAYDTAPTLLCYYFSYWSGVPFEGFEGHYKNRRAIFSFPTNDGLCAVFAAFPIEEMAQVRTDIERHFMDVADAAGDLGERLRAGTREERFYGATDLPNFYRKPYGPGWALVGDAGNHKDPFLALGMADALRDAELLADALDDAFAGGAPLAQALARYETRRNEASMRDYKQNLALARFEPIPPQAFQVRAAIRGDAIEMRRWAMARIGMIPEADFFNQAHLAELMARMPGGAAAGA
jgi:flavin-dependent dehydrogenase